MFALTTTLIVLLAPAPAAPRLAPATTDRPIRWRTDVDGFLGHAIVGHPSWRAFDLDRSAFLLGTNVRADGRLANGRVFLGGGLGYRRHHGAGSVYNGAFLTSATIREPNAFIRMSIVAIEGVDVLVQAGGGPSFYDIKVSSAQWATQRSVGAMAEGLAGVALYLPKKWLPRRGSSRFCFGLEVLGGYTWHNRMPVRPDLDVPDDPIAGSAADFGDLKARGGTWRLGIFIRFQ